VDALLTLSSKGQLVIPARLRQLLGLNPGDRLELTLEPNGLLLKPHSSPKLSSARDRIGCSGYQGPTIPLDQQDPASMPPISCYDAVRGPRHQSAGEAAQRR
jgi:AbrB family looped-hinge helix DNA binding protein